MRKISIEHRHLGRGYLMVIEGVSETILLSADSLLFLADWGIAHRQEIEQESKEEYDEDARRLLDYD